MYYFNKQNTFLKDFDETTKLGYDSIGSIKPLFWFIIYLLSVGLLYFIPGIIAIPFGIFISIFVAVTGNIDTLISIENNPWLDWSSLIFSTGIVILIFFLYIRLVERRPFSTIGLRSNIKLKKYLLGAAIAIIMQLFYFSIVLLFGWAEVISQPVHSTTALGTSAIGFVFLFLIGFIVQGASEEIAVRGWMLPVLSRHYKVSTAIIISSLFFGLLHILNPNLSALSIINLVLYGVFASLYALYDGGLWGIFAQHSIWNWFMGNVLGLPVSGMIAGKISIIETTLSGPDWITGGAFGPEGGIIETLMLSVSILILIKLLIKKGILKKSIPSFDSDPRANGI